jgi:predicted ATPase
MIRKFKASGFRSLQSFEMDIHPGLNVLVGPNGVGKTNIVDALQLLTLLAKRPLNEAIGELGGIGSVVTKGAQQSGQFSLEVFGERLASKEKFLSPTHRQIETRESLRGIVWTYYDYSVVIEADAEKLRVKEEKFRVWLRRVRRSRGVLRAVEENVGPDFAVSRAADEEGLLRAKGSYQSRIPGLFDYQYTRRLESSLHGDVFDDGDSEGEKTLLFHAFQHSKYVFLRNVLSDFDLGEPFNILPGKVREPLDVSAGQMIEHDGRGFAAALRGLEEKKKTNVLGRQGPSIERFIEHVRLANPAIKSISVVLDTWESRLKATVDLQSAKGDVKVPLSALSDGTLKWIALMMAIETDAKMLGIEEPENYVHPASQKVLIEILRNHLEAPSRAQEFMLLTTHSETLINALVPSEIVVVAMDNGTTVAKRLSDTKLLMEEIRKTGFGLGHYYLTGALDA